MEKEIWITEKEVSKITGIAVQTLRNDRHLCRGIPYYKRNRSVRYKEADVRGNMELFRIDHGHSGEARVHP
jgi:hypothetical protein